MKKIGFIPLRKGSKGIRGKNKRKMAGRPLFTWVLGEAIFSKLDEIYLYTDDQDVIDFIDQEYSYTNKVKAILRSEETASDTASTELAMLTFCESINYNFDVFCLLQATSPMTQRTDIDRCLEKQEEGNDSALTVVNTHRFVWSQEGAPVNYSLAERPRRQDFEGLLVENGAVYVTTKLSLQKNKNRIGDKIAVVKMPADSLYEVDSESDWLIVEQLLIKRQKSTKKSTEITHLILDVDGVFTDGSVAFGKEGELWKQFDMRDGMGLEILRQFGIKILVMTSEQSELVSKRMQKLKIENCYLGVKDKFSLLQHILKEESLSAGNFAYIGDDVNDLVNMCSVGWSFAPNNAVDIVKQHADVVLSKASGAGAIREACKFIVKYNSRFL